MLNYLIGKVMPRHSEVHSGLLEREGVAVEMLGRAVQTRMWPT